MLGLFVLLELAIQLAEFFGLSAGLLKKTAPWCYVKISDVHFIVISVHFCCIFACFLLDLKKIGFWKEKMLLLAYILVVYLGCKHYSDDRNSCPGSAITTRPDELFSSQALFSFYMASEVLGITRVFRH